jgi:hypothetical protein
MVFESDDERERLVAQLRRLGARPDLVAWVADPTTDLNLLGGGVAVPFWDEVLRRLDMATPGELVVHEPLFSLALQAYLECWRVEAEQRDLFEAVQILGRAARDHLSSRPHVAD